MKKYSLIIKNNIVVDKCVSTSIVNWHPINPDLILEDINKNVPIGAEYNPQTGEFNVIARPYDEENNLDELG